MWKQDANRKGSILNYFNIYWFYVKIDEDFEENISEKDDIYGDFSWGGLIGQEAYDAMWNCD